MSTNQPPPYGGAPDGQPNPYAQNPYAQPPGGQPGVPGQPGPYDQNPYGQNPYGQAPYGQNPYGQPGIPSYPGGGQQDLHSYGQQAPTGMPPLAHWGWRVASALIDGVLIFVVNLVLQLGVKGGAGLGLSLVVDLAFTVGYAWMEGTRGQTPGKMAVGTRTLREADGQLLGFGRALGRRLLHVLDALPCYLGFLWPLWDDKKQTFADKIVHSVVIKP